ncbi:MAG: hypothetical protein ACE5G8_05230 [Anaerolineae bacterium]
MYRQPAALQLTAPGLAEFVKFLPEKRLGLLALQRLHYLLPLAVAAFSLPLLAANKEMRLARSVSGLLRLAVLPAALALLSPVWAPGVLLNEEFRLQTVAAAVAVGLAVVAPLFSRLPLKWLAAAIAIGAGAGLVLALKQFGLAGPAIAAAYAAPIRLGWGGWLAVGGGGGAIAAALRVWMR